MTTYPKPKTTGLFIFCIFLLAFSNRLFAQDTPVVKISNGFIKGVNELKSKVFKGIPYATAPVGKLRFKAPQPAQNWTDTLDCTHFGQPSAQFAEATKPLKGAEDCLSLNVYTASSSQANLKPVLVWIHGGGMTAGSGIGQNGHAFADTDSIVTVTINYRLGVFGFLYLGDVGAEYAASGNNAVQDCVMALKWIKANISAFGGDPARVTVMGESAGAKLASTLLVSPSAKGYFQQMVLESGALQCIRDTVTAKSIRHRLMQLLNVTQPSQLLDMPAEKLIEAQTKVCNGAQGTNYFGPVADGVILSDNPYTYLERHPVKEVRLLIGTNKEESIMFMKSDKRLYNPDQQVLKDWFGNNAPLVWANYQHQLKKQSPERAAVEVLTQYMYQMHSYRLASQLAAAGNQLWMYRFDFDKDGTVATHAKELAYVWSFAVENPQQPKQQLANTMHRNWVNFIQGRTPGKADGQDWPAYQPGSKSIMIFDSPSRTVGLKNVFDDPAYPAAGFVLKP